MQTQQTTRNIDVVSASVGASVGAKATELQPQSVVSEDTAKGVDTDVHREVSATRDEGEKYINMSNGFSLEVSVDKVDKRI